MLTLPDLSAALNTIDNEILLGRLQSYSDVNGTALKWMIWYITEEKQFVSVLGRDLETVQLSFGVPQGSCLGISLAYNVHKTSIRFDCQTSS